MSRGLPATFEGRGDFTAFHDGFYPCGPYGSPTSKVLMVVLVGFGPTYIRVKGAHVNRFIIAP